MSLSAPFSQQGNCVTQFTVKWPTHARALTLYNWLYHYIYQWVQTKIHAFTLHTVAYMYTHNTVDLHLAPKPNSVHLHFVSRIYSCTMVILLTLWSVPPSALSLSQSITVSMPGVKWLGPELLSFLADDWPITEKRDSFRLLNPVTTF